MKCLLTQTVIVFMNVQILFFGDEVDADDDDDVGLMMKLNIMMDMLIMIIPEVLWWC